VPTSPATTASALRIYSYIVARDFGFAPNPFFGWCTLATCKPVIRRTARVGDWIMGTGSADKERAGRAIYAMQVDAAMTFGEYWADPRFARKHPDLSASRKLAFGDNIYSPGEGGGWRQLDSHHSLHDGKPNPVNIVADTKTNRVLVSRNHIYWGDDGPMVPTELRSFGDDQEDICCKTQGHRCCFGSDLVAATACWLMGFEDRGLQGRPADW
jgi:Nucleotide modification associated domain 2